MLRRQRRGRWIRFVVFSRSHVWRATSGMAIRNLPPSETGAATKVVAPINSYAVPFLAEHRLIDRADLERLHIAEPFGRPGNFLGFRIINDKLRRVVVIQLHGVRLCRRSI